MSPPITAFCGSSRSTNYPADKVGDVLTVEFTVAGVSMGFHVQAYEAFSFQMATDDQEETDCYWDAIVGNGGQESQCGWFKSPGKSRRAY